MYCVKGKFYGLTRDGFFAESKSMLPRTLIPVPAGVSDEEAAVVEPVALALRVLDYMKLNLGDWATLIGQGPIGLLMSQVAHLKGCHVIAVDLEDYRLEFSRKYGADEVANAKTEDVVKSVRKLTKHGSDLVIEAAGTRQTVELTPFLVRKAGKVALGGRIQGVLEFGGCR